MNTIEKVFLVLSVDGETLIDLAKANDPTGPFATYFADGSDALLLHYLSVKDITNAFEIIKNRELLTYQTLGDTHTSLLNHIIANDCTDLFPLIDDFFRQKIKDLLEHDKPKAAINLFIRCSGINLFDKIDGKSILEIAMENGEESPFILYFEQNISEYFLQCLEAREESLLIDLIRDEDISLSSMIGEYNVETLLREKGFEHIIAMALATSPQASMDMREQLRHYKAALDEAKDPTPSPKQKQ